MLDIRYLIGPHVLCSREGLTEHVPILYHKGVRVFQMFLGTSPKRLQLPSHEFTTLFRQLPRDISVVIQAPHLINLVSPFAPNSESSMLYLCRALRACSELGIASMVTRLGVIGGTDSAGKMGAWKSAREFLSKLMGLTGDISTKLLLENDHGAPAGNLVANVPFVYKLVESLNHPNICMCLNTEYAWAHGWEISDPLLIQKVLSRTRVVHLSAIPQDVAFGSFSGVYSFTSLRDSQAKDSLITVAKLALSQQIPMILERASLETFYDDIRFLGESMM